VLTESGGDGGLFLCVDVAVSSITIEKEQREERRSMKVCPASY